MPLIDFFVLVSQTFCRASSGALTFAGSISELLNFGFLFEGLAKCPVRSSTYDLAPHVSVVARPGLPWQGLGRALNCTGPPRRQRNSLTRDTRHRLGRTRRRNGARPRDLGGGPSRVDCAWVPYVGSPGGGIDRAWVADVRGRGAGIYTQRLWSRGMN